MAATLALAAVAPGAAEAAGWNVTIEIAGGGAVEGEGIRCDSTCVKHFTTTIGQHPFGRTVSLEAKPATWSDTAATWTEGCSTVEGNTCRVVLPLIIPTPWDPATVKDRKVAVTFPDSDVDNDGQTGSAAGGVDCNDHDAAIHTGAHDIPGNGIDEDCDGVDAHDADQDDDGYSEQDDCNDGDPKIHPGARDVPRNGVDEDCKDGDNRDADGDGYEDPAELGKKDCDDRNAAVHPNALDHPDNGIDEDCDGRDVERPDRDGDGYSRPADCRDDVAGIHPGARDKPRNGTDEDCDGRDADYPAIMSDIVHAERGAGRFTVIRRLGVTTPPAGTTVTLKCKGKGCRFKTRTVRSVPGSEVLSLVQHFRRTKLAPGARVEVAVRAPETYGKLLRLSIRKGAAPKVAWLKIDPITGAVTPW